MGTSLGCRCCNGLWGGTNRPRGLPGRAAGRWPGIRATSQAQPLAKPRQPPASLLEGPGTPGSHPDPLLPHHCWCSSHMSLVPTGCLAGGSAMPAASQQLHFPNERLMRVMIQWPLPPDPWGARAGRSPSTELVAVPPSPRLGVDGRSCYSWRRRSPARLREHPLSHAAPCHLPPGLYLPRSRQRGFRMNPRRRRRTSARQDEP